MAFLQRPFHALLKFSMNFTLASGIGYVLSSKVCAETLRSNPYHHVFLKFYYSPKLPLILKFLNLFDVNKEATGTGTDILLSLLVVSPIMVSYVKAVEWTSVSFEVFVHSLLTWWNYSWITVEMSNENMNGRSNLSRTHSGDDLMSPTSSSLQCCE